MKNSNTSKRTVIIGGKFNQFHNGHKDYIKVAFDYADEVFIFLSTDEYAKICKSCFVAPYKFRKKSIENYINAIKGTKRYSIYKLDSEGTLINFCIHKQITMAIVSPEYYALFQRINNIREDEGHTPMLLMVKQRTKTKEGFDVSSTLINNLKYEKRISPIEYSANLVTHAAPAAFGNI